jgi:predicted kinase
MKILYVIIGPAGSGKSTFAAKLKEEFNTTEDIICCADDYHMVNGEYKWSLDNQGMAHTKCKNKCESLMKDSSANIIVANTNLSWKEIKTYVTFAASYGYNVIFGLPRFNLTVEELKERNVHNVPQASLEAMKSRMITQDDLKNHMIEFFPEVPFLIQQFENK